MNRKRALQLFEQAIEMPAGERQAFLKNECADDADVLKQVVEMLDLHAESSSS